MPILISRSCIDVDLHSSSSSCIVLFFLSFVLQLPEYICYQVLSYYVLSPRQYLFWYFVKVKQIPHWHQKLILNCIHSMAAYRDWLCTGPIQQTHGTHCMGVLCRFRISNAYCFCSFALELFSDWKSESHNPSPENTASFLHTFPLTCLICIIYELFHERLSVVFCACLVLAMRIVSWPLDNNIVKILQIAVYFKEE